MTDQLVIEDSQLAKQIQQIAEQERRSIEAVLFSMVMQYRSPANIEEIPDAEDLARFVRIAAYQQARDYWNKIGNNERANLSDQQLDEAFWLFDADGIPRLKADKNDVELPEDSIHRAGQVLRSAGFRSGQKDISVRSREILEDEFTDYLLTRRNESIDDADNSSATG